MKEPLDEDSLLRSGELRNGLTQILQAKGRHSVTLLQMPREVVREYTWPATPARVHNIFTDAQFQRTLAESTGSLDVQCQVEQSPQGCIVQTTRVLPAQVPSFARPLVGETVRVEEEQRWGPFEDDRTMADLRISFSGPLAGSGSIHLGPGPTGETTIGRFALQFRANVPFVAGKVEALIAEQIEQYLDVQAALITRTLADSA